MKLLIRLAYFASILIQGVLGIRIVLIAVGAGTDNTVAYWIKKISDVLVSPFKGIVDSTINIGKIQIPSLLILSLVIYVIVSIILSELLKSYKDND